MDDINLIEKLNHIKMFIISQSKSKWKDVDGLLKWLIELEENKWYAFCNIYISKKDWKRFLKILTIISADKLLVSYNSDFVTHLSLYYELKFPNNSISLIYPDDYNKIENKDIEIECWNILFKMTSFFDFLNIQDIFNYKKIIRYEKIPEDKFNLFKKIQ